ncbi:wax ester/triacylglycerol synthase domain-containing protein [Amycolatopsis sp. NPDC051102]|uniref:wax ester/triacylglycerol synthase domain-containing protein n=1 Tax=Amycolatopsis sp. NPDC051102 TaxID=3155163 RepID=UPI003413F901
MENADNATRTPVDQRNDRIPAGFFDRFLMEVGALGPRESDLYIGGVLLVGGPAPSFEALRDRLAGQARHIPALGYRLVGDGREGWEKAPGFDPRDHIDAVSLPPGTDVLTASLDVAARPLSPGRPLWGLTMVHGYSGDEYALCYRAHHSFQDGLAIVQVVSALLSTSAPPRPAPERPTARRRSANRSWRALTDFGIPLKRTADDWPPFTPPLTGRRVLVTASLSAAAVRDVTAATGASTHQVCLTAIAGAMREWTPDRWTGKGGRNKVRNPHVLIPLDLKRSRNVAEPGNYLCLMRVELPCGEPAALARLRAITTQTAPDRLLRHRNRYRTLLKVLPYRVTGTIIRRLTDRRYVCMVVSTLRASVDVSAEDGTARGLYALPPLYPGHHGMVVILQQPDVLTVSVLLDECVPDAGRFPELVVAAVDRLRTEVASASGGGSAGSR